MSNTSQLADDLEAAKVIIIQQRATRKRMAQAARDRRNANRVAVQESYVRALTFALSVLPPAKPTA